ncbi:MAG: hypothetical protein ACWA5W_09700 [Phycisphaerales bacterium]
MSTINTRYDQPRLSKDDRYELAAIAQNQLRLNSPKHLLALGIFCVVISLVILAIAWQSRAGAEKSLAKRQRELTQINQLITQITALEAAQASNPDQDRFKPIPDMLSQLKRFGTQAQLEHDIGLPKNQKSLPEGNAILKKYPYVLRDPSLERLLDWIRISTEQIPGLEVTDLTIKPAKNDWTMTVTLSRYERKE